MSADQLLTSRISSSVIGPVYGGVTADWLLQIQPVDLLLYSVTFLSFEMLASYWLSLYQQALFSRIAFILWQESLL